MKKTTLMLALVLITVASFAQKDSTKKAAPQPPSTVVETTKEYSLKGDLQLMQTLYNALEDSNAPHKLIVKLKAWIEQQVTEQSQPAGADPKKK